MSQSFKIHVDRAVDALALIGVRRKRSAVAEVMAATFGYRSSNEALAAGEEGRLDPPAATLARDVAPDGLVVLHDPVAGEPFGVAAGRLAPGRGTRASDHVLSPYGNLLDVSGVRRAIAAPPRDAAPADGAAMARPAPQALGDLVADALRRRARSLTIEPTPAGATVWNRVDGVRRAVATLDRPAQLALTAEVRAAAGIDAAFGDGSWAVGPVDVAAATFPNPYGELTTLRLVVPEDPAPDLEGLGLTDAGRLVRALQEPAGIHVVAGHTGSGRSRTLAAMAAALDARGARGLLPSGSAARPVARQIPPVDFVAMGELRTEAEFRLAASASDAGHVVLGIVSAVTVAHALRILGRHVPRDSLLQGLRGVVAQTLVRTICVDCRGVPRGTPCRRCEGVGQAGRTAISEVATFRGPDDVAAALAAALAAAEAPRAIRVLPWRGMFDDALDKVAAGLVSLDELAQAFGSDAIDLAARRGLHRVAAPVASHA